MQKRLFNRRLRLFHLKVGFVSSYAIYIQAAAEEDSRITHIFETHRNEDYVIGSKELAEKTGARILHGADLPFEYGEPVREGDSFKLGSLRLGILHTPGHTMESISITVVDTNFSDDPVGVFTGDVLFVGDVGRIDFFPDRKREVAGMLYDSIFEKLLPLGDDVLLYPAHGAGSVCGEGMASREFSSLGYERKHNPILQKERDDFIEIKEREYHVFPNYFKKMEELNLRGAPLMGDIPRPVPMHCDDISIMIKQGSIVLDLRSPEAFAGAFIPGTLAIPLKMLPAFAGHLLPYDRDIALIPESHDQVDKAVRYLLRLGYDNIKGYLVGGLHEWEADGRRYEQIPAIHAVDLQERIDSGKDFMLLDVRKKTEFEDGHLKDAVNIVLSELLEHIDEMPEDKLITTFCGSGRRAMIAASLLRNAGFKQVEDCLGSIAACEETGCKIIRERQNTK